MKITNGRNVSLEYTITDTVTGEVLESSGQDGPMVYLHGEGEIPAAVEAALEGRERGAAFEIDLPPEDAYGEYNPDGLVTVPRSQFSEDQALDVGLWVDLEIEDDDGDSETLETRVVELNADAVVLDANHPLAGRKVTFKLRVLEVE